MGLNVIYDTSVLGFGEYSATGRTGVYRLVENNVQALLKAPQVDLSFTAAESMRMLVHAYDYLEQKLCLKGHSLLAFGRLAQTYHRLESMRSQLLSENISTPKRALRRILSESLQELDRWVKPLGKNDLSKAHVFHSPYWGLPEVTQGVKGLSRILTVHDLACILHPEKSEDGGDFLRGILSTVTPRDWVICVSESTRRDFCQFRKDFPKERVKVIHSAAAEHFKPVQDPKILKTALQKYGISDIPYFLSVSSLEKRKNLLTLVRAFAAFNRFTPDTQLVLAGPAAQAEPEIKKLINELKLPKTKIHFTGFIDDRDLPALYSACLAFVYPSFYEGFGFPPLEAMQCGAAVITSNTSSLPEVIGNAGIMVPPTNTAAWVEALATVSSNKKTLDEMKIWSREQATQFSWQKNTHALLQTYELASSKE